jgi:hypothetical protein
MLCFYCIYLIVVETVFMIVWSITTQGCWNIDYLWDWSGSFFYRLTCQICTVQRNYSHSHSFRRSQSLLTSITVTPYVYHTVTPSVDHIAIPYSYHTVTPVDHIVTPYVYQSLVPSTTVTPYVYYTVTPSVDHRATPWVYRTVTPSVDHVVTPSVDHTLTPSVNHRVTRSEDDAVRQSLSQNSILSVDQPFSLAISHSVAGWVSVVITVWSSYHSIIRIISTQQVYCPVLRKQITTC